MGVQLSKNNGERILMKSPREQLMKMLVDKTRSVGHIVSFTEVSEDSEMVNPNDYAFYFGSFNEAAQIAWKKVQNLQYGTSTPKSGAARITIPNSRKPISPTTTDKPINTHPVKTLKPKSSRASRTQKYSYDQIKDMVIAFYKQNGRLPTQTDANSNPDLPSWVTLYKHLGKRSEWGRLIPPGLEKTPDPDARAVTPSPTGEPTIDTDYHWEDGTLLVEVKVLKPGGQTPIRITLAV